MAEKPDDQVTAEEKVTKAKEMYARGLRNYYVKSYSEAADDLSEASKLYGEVYGISADELGEVYLLYAKALIAIGQEENKLIDVPEDDEEEDEPAEEDDGDEEETNEAEAAGSSNGAAENGEKVNGHSIEDAQKSDEEPQPGPSGMKENSNDADDEATVDDAEDGGNLEVAWEVLQNAALIFERQGDSGMYNLMEVFIEMAGISLENGNFEISQKDFNRALDVYGDLDDKNQRIAAEIYYKIGLCQVMMKQYDESVKSFQTAADLVAEVIAKEKAREEQTEDVLATIQDLEETQKDILNKITEVGETKAEEIEEVKKELTKMFGPSAGSSSADGAGPSSTTSDIVSLSKSPEADKPKPMDISHLIKRKKPDATDGSEESPAKKKAVETSPGDKPSVPVQPVIEEKLADEPASVQVVIDN